MASEGRSGRQRRGRSGFGRALLGVLLAPVLALGGGAGARADDGLVADDDANVIIGLTETHMWSADGGASWERGAPGQEFRGRQDVIVAVADDEVLASVPWDPSQTYAEAGTLVLHEGALYRNGWWAGPDDVPGLSDVWRKVRDVQLQVVGEFTFTPWTGERAEQFQRDERDRVLASPKVVGYVPEWGIYEAHDFFGIDDVDFDQITHLNYAFGLLRQDVSGTWGVVVGDPWAAVEKDGGLFRQAADATAAHGVENMVSVGGWTNSQNGEFEDATSTPEKTDHLATSMVDFMVEHGFTGIDVDWEYPADEQAAGQFEGLIRTLREKLTALGMESDQYHQLSVAVTANHHDMAFVRPAVLKDLVDTVNVMTYDFHGAFDPVTGHNAPLHASARDADPAFNTAEALRAYHEVHGVPKNQLLAGIPYYGRAWGEVDPIELVEGLPGLGAPGSATVHGQWDDEHEYTGTNPWTVLRTLEADDAYQQYWDDEARVPYLYNPTTREFFTYDNPRSIQEKVDFIQDEGYGGAIIWDLSGDTRDHELGQIVAQLLTTDDGDDDGGDQPGDSDGGGQPGDDHGGGQPPAAEVDTYSPRDLVATVRADGAVHLRWEGPAALEDFVSPGREWGSVIYRVERRPATGGGWTEVQRVVAPDDAPTSGGSALDPGTAPGTTSVYRVVANIPFGITGWSEEIRVAIPALPSSPGSPGA